MAGIASLITAIMLGSFSVFIPGFNPVDYLYQLLFGESIPDYLYNGFYAIGHFSLLYSFVALLLSPLSCAAGVTARSFDFDRPSKEDLIFFPLLYLVYVYVLYVQDMLTYESAVVGVFAITLPLVYRLLVYFVQGGLERYRSSCYFSLYVFVVSIVLCIPLTVIYLAAINCVLSFLSSA